MKRSILIENEYQLLEEAIVQHGSIVSFLELHQLFNKDIQYTRKRISKLVEDGWLTRVKKGLYVISDLSTRGTLAIDQRIVVNLLVENAYISFQSALQFHGFFDQLLGMIISVSLERQKARKVGFNTYSFVYTQEKYFYGWETHIIDGHRVKVASFEKALIDMIQFHRTTYSTDIVMEKLLDYQDEINHNKLVNYLLHSNLTTRRIFGFLLDYIDMNTEELLVSVKNGTSVSSIGDSENQLYNHKWKLYYDKFFEQYANKNN